MKPLLPRGEFVLLQNYIARMLALNCYRGYLTFLYILRNPCGQQFEYTAHLVNRQVQYTCFTEALVSLHPPVYAAYQLHTIVEIPNFLPCKCLCSCQSVYKRGTTLLWLQLEHICRRFSSTKKANQVNLSATLK